MWMGRKVSIPEHIRLRSSKKTIKHNDIAFTASDQISQSVVDLSKHRFFYMVDGAPRCASLPFTDDRAQLVFAAATPVSSSDGGTEDADEINGRTRES